LGLSNIGGRELNAETQQEPINYIQAIKQTEERFVKVAPQAMKFDAEVGFAIALINNNEYLKRGAIECPQSLQQAMASVAAIGLSLNPAKKEAYLITRNVKTKAADGREFWQTRIHLEPSYMGLCNIATNTGSIDWVQARCVYAEDEFIDHGPGLRPTHNYNAFKKDRGEFVGVYCVAKAGGDYLTTTMTADDVISIRDRSEAWKRNQSGPWKTDFEEMAKKSVIRNAFKTWPKTDKLARMEEAVHISNDNEGFEPILTSPVLGQYSAEQKQYFDQMIVKGDAIGMYVLQRTIDESTFTNLYHSFERGQKGKYQEMIRKLLEEGASRITDCVTAITDSLDSGDDAGVLEIVDGMAEDAVRIIQDRLQPSHMAAFIKLTQAGE